MSEINQLLFGGLDTSPPKNATQHSHASDSDQETASIEEDEAGVNPYPVVVDELVVDGDNPGDDSYNVEGTVNPQERGGYSKDTTMEKENEGNQTTVSIGGDDEGSGERERERERLIHAKGRPITKLLSFQLLQLFRQAKFRQVVQGAFLQKDWPF